MGALKDLCSLRKAHLGRPLDTILPLLAKLAHSAESCPRIDNGHIAVLLRSVKDLTSIASCGMLNSCVSIYQSMPVSVVFPSHDRSGEYILEL